MKKFIVISALVLTLVTVIWAQTAPQGDGIVGNADIHGTNDTTGGSEDHGMEPGADNDGDGEPDTIIFEEDMGAAPGLQNGLQAGPGVGVNTHPMGAKTMLHHRTDVHADGTVCVIYVNVTDVTAPGVMPWQGLITVVEFCCEDMNAQWGSHCYWNVYYRYINAWVGGSADISDAEVDATIAATQPSNTSGPRAGQTQ